MTLDQVADALIRNIQAIHTDETRFDLDFTFAEIHTIRGVAMALYFQKFKRISPLWLQTLDLTYDPLLQEDLPDPSICITKYELPQYIQLDGRQDGVSYLGNDKNQSFRRIRTRAELSTLKKHPRLNPANGNYVGVLTDNTFVEVYATTKVKRLLVSLILADPNDDPAYNYQVDPYPISVDLLPMMTDQLMKVYFNRMAAIPVDTAPNKIDVPLQTPSRR